MNEVNEKIALIAKLGKKDDEGASWREPFSLCQKKLKILETLPERKCINGFVFYEKLEWGACNEGNILIDSLKWHKEKYGFYSEALLADKIYRAKEKRLYLVI